MRVRYQSKNPGASIQTRLDGARTNQTVVGFVRNRLVEGLDVRSLLTEPEREEVAAHWDKWVKQIEDEARFWREQAEALKERERKEQERIERFAQTAIALADIAKELNYPRSWLVTRCKQADIERIKVNGKWKVSPDDAVALRNYVRAEEQGEALSETAWKKEGRAIKPGEHPIARKTFSAGGRKQITYGVYAMRQTIPLK